MAGIPNTNEIRIFNPRTQFFTRFDEYNKERGIVAGVSNAKSIIRVYLISLDFTSSPLLLDQMELCLQELE